MHGHVHTARCFWSHLIPTMLASALTGRALLTSLPVQLSCVQLQPVHTAADDQMLEARSRTAAAASCYRQAQSSIYFYYSQHHSYQHQKRLVPSALKHGFTRADTLQTESIYSHHPSQLPVHHHHDYTTLLKYLYTTS